MLAPGDTTPEQTKQSFSVHFVPAQLRTKDSCNVGWCSFMLFLFSLQETILLKVACTV